MSVASSDFATATESPTDDRTDQPGSRSAEHRCGEKITDGHSSGSKRSKSFVGENSMADLKLIDVEFQGYGNLSAPTIPAKMPRFVEGSVEEVSCPVGIGAQVSSSEKSPQTTNALNCPSPTTVRPIAQSEKPWQSRRSYKEALLAYIGEALGQSPASEGGHRNTNLGPRGNHYNPGRQPQVPRT